MHQTIELFIWNSVDCGAQSSLYLHFREGSWARYDVIIKYHTAFTKAKAFSIITIAGLGLTSKYIRYDWVPPPISHSNEIRVRDMVHFRIIFEQRFLVLWGKKICHWYSNILSYIY